MKLSVCAIIKNEESRIAAFIRAAEYYADEIVLVDNGSSDRTVEIVRQFPEVKLLFSDEKFDLARNTYLAAAEGDWILNLDTDERLEIRFAEQLKHMLQQEPVDVQGVILPCMNYFGKGAWTQWNLPRILRNSRKHEVTDAIHTSFAQSALKDGGRLDFIYAPIHHYDALWNRDQSGKRERNLKLVEEALGEKPGKSGLYKNLANEYYALGQKGKAIETIRIGLEKDTSHSGRLYKGLANYYYGAGMFEEAIAAADKQIEEFLPLASEEDGRAARYQLEIEACRTITYKALYALGREKEAICLCTQNIQEHPQLPHNYLNRYIMTGKSERNDYEMAVLLNPMLMDETIYCDKAQGDLYSFASSVILE